MYYNNRRPLGLRGGPPLNPPRSSRTFLHRKHARSIGISASLIFGATLISRVAGFVREIAMALMFGTSLKTDAWLIASVIPNLLFSTINGAISTTIVPVLTEGERTHSPRSMAHFIQELFTVIILLSLTLVLLGELFAPLLIHLIAPGFTDVPKEYHLALVMTRWMIPTILFWGLAGLSIGVLQSREDYVPAAMSPVVINVVRITSIFVLGSIWGIVGVSIGFSLAVLAQLALLLPALANTGYHLKFRWRFGHPLLRRIGRIAAPFFLSSSVGTVGQIVDRILASYLVIGSIAALNYSFVLVQVPISLLISSLATPIYTRLAQHHSRHDDETFTALAMRGFRLVLLIIVPMTAWFLLLRVPILRLIYQHGAFSGRSTALTQGTLLYFAIGLPGFALSFYMQRLFFATQDTRHPARFSIITILINIAGDLILVHPMKAEGLALATGGAQWVNAFMLTRRALGPKQRESVKFKRTMLQLGLAGGCLSAATWAMRMFLDLSAWSGIIPLLFGMALVVGVSGLAYAVILAITHFPEMDQLRLRIGRMSR